jgi:hypothetical protein
MILFFVGLTIVGTVIISFVWKVAPHTNNEEDDREFDRVTWIAEYGKEDNGGNLRHYMIEDLLENNLILGMDSIDVKKMLGEPERDFGFSYMLGHYRSGFDPSFLILKFDQNGKLIRAEVQTI